MTGLGRPTGVSSFTWKPTPFGNCVSLVLRSRMLSLSCHEFPESTNAFCSLILQSEVPCDFCLWQSSVGSKRNTCVSLSRPVVEDFPSEVDDWPRRKAVSTCRYLVIFPYVTLRRQVSPSFMRMTKTQREPHSVLHEMEIPEHGFGQSVMVTPRLFSYAASQDCRLCIMALQGR